MKKLGRSRQNIARGARPDVSLEMVHAYRKMWESQGYDLPPLDGKPTPEPIRGIGDVAARVFKLLLGIEVCSRCDSRRKWLNRVVPFPLQWPGSAWCRP